MEDVAVGAEPVSSTASAVEPILSLRTPKNRLARRALWLGMIENAIAAAVVTALVVFGATFVNEPWWLWLLYAALCFDGVFISPVIHYRVYRWEVTDRAIYTQAGWLSREVKIAPMARVQTVDVDQGVVARYLGLAEVRVTTASSSGSLEIKGLDARVATDLVESLTKVIEDSPGDGT